MRVEFQSKQMQGFTQGQTIVNMPIQQDQEILCQKLILYQQKKTMKRFTMTLCFLIILMRFGRKTSKELNFNLLQFHLHVCSVLHIQVWYPSFRELYKKDNEKIQRRASKLV